MITPMKYITILCMKEDRDCVLSELQKCGEVMVCAPAELSRNAAPPVYDAASIETLIRELKRYEQKKPLFGSLPELDLAEFEQIGAEAEAVVEELQKLMDGVAADEAAFQAKTALREQLLPWETLDIPVEEIRETYYTFSILGEIPIRNLDLCRAVAEEKDRKSVV